MPGGRTPPLLSPFQFSTYWHPCRGQRIGEASHPGPREFGRLNDPALIHSAQADVYDSTCLLCLEKVSPPPPACGSRVHAQAPSRLLGGRSETCAGGALRAVPHPLSMVGHDMGRDRPSSGPRGVPLCLVVGIHGPTPSSPPIPRSSPYSTWSRNPGNSGPFDRTCNSWQAPDAPKDSRRHTPRFQTPGRSGSDGQNGIPPLGFSGPMGIPPLESPGDRPDRFRPHDMEMDYVAERPLYGQMALGRPTTLPLHALATVALGGRGVLLVHPRPYRQP